MLSKNCEICGTLFLKQYKDTVERFSKRRFCSQRCNGIWKKGKDFVKPENRFNLSEKGRKKISKRSLGNSYAKGYKHTEDAKKKMIINRSGEKHWDWKGDKASYSAVHKWLVKNYGPANMCENKTCINKSKKYQYALKHNHKYNHNRNNFGMLCVSCHKYYDSRENKLNVRL